MAYKIPTIPAWLLPLLVLVVVCVVAGWSSFKKMMEPFVGSSEGSSKGSTDTCKKEYTTCMDASGSMTDCTAAYNKCMATQGFTGAPVVAPTTTKPPADVAASDAEYKKYLEEIKKRNADSPSPIPPTPQELARIGGGTPPDSTPASYTRHVEGFHPHEMPRQTEGFTLQQMVRSEKEEREW